MSYNPNNPNGNAITANSAPVTLAADTITGSLGALNATVVVPSVGAGTSIFQLSGTWVGTVTFEGSNDNFVTSQAIAAVYLGGLATQSSSWTTNGFYSVITAGFKKMQARMSAYTSGTVTVAADTMSSNRISVALQGNPNNLQTLASQGPAGTVAWKVDGSAVVQPVFNATLPLPALAATSTKQSDGTQKTQIVDGSGNVIPSVLVGGLQRFAVTLAAGAVPGSAAPSFVDMVGGTDGTNARQFNVDTTGKLNVNNISGTISLPTGAALDASVTQSQGTVAAGAAATKSTLIGGVFNTSLPTLTAGQQAAVQLDSLGRQIIVSPGIPTTLGQQAAATSQPVTLSNENVQDAYTTGASAQTATVNNILTPASGTAATDSIGYRNMSVQVISTGTAGTFIFEGSNDNVNFQTIPVYSQLIGSGTAIVAAVTASISNFIYVFPVPARYIRLRIATAITGGSIQAFTKSAQVPFAPAFFTASQSVASNLQTTATISSGTVTTVTTLANGQTAHSAPSTGSPVRVAGRVNTTLDTTLIQGDASDLFMSTAGQLVEKPYSTAENDWQATSGITPLATNTSTALKAAGAASIRNYATAIQLYNTSATVSTTVSILDGATVIWTGFVPATTAALPVVDVHVVLPTPLRGTAATALNIQCGTTGASVYYNVQGYQSF